jgi:hypothetical protein
VGAAGSADPVGMRIDHHARNLFVFVEDLRDPQTRHNEFRSWHNLATEHGD